MREARAGDRYLLCSDGLSDPVSDETIHEALQIPDVAESAYRLIELALRGGGPDNVTVVVADVVDYDYGQTQPILAGAVSGEEDQLTLPNTSAGRASAIGPRKEAAKRVVATRGAGAADPGGRGGGCSSSSRWWCCWRSRAWPSDEPSSAATTTSPITTAWCRSCGEFKGRCWACPCTSPIWWAASTRATSYPIISYSQSGSHLDCRMMQLQDLRPAERAQVFGRASGRDSGRRRIAVAGVVGQQPTCRPARRLAPPRRPGHRPRRPTRPHQPSATAPPDPFQRHPTEQHRSASPTPASTTPAAPATTSPTPLPRKRAVPPPRR